GINRVAKNVSRKRKELEALLDISLQEKIVLLTIGRLVKRKGVYWFVNNVMPELDEKFIFVIAGDGPERDSIKKCIQNKNLNRRVFCLGFVTEQIKSSLFSNSDLFVQPNIKVEGDMEGFGISVLEANLHGLAVLGSKLEGLEDSIVHGKNGWQVPPGDTGAYVSAINQKAEEPATLSRIGEKAREYCLNHFCWDEIAERYLRSIAAAGKSKHPHR
ncbi:MAG: glycosyltransferase family 4 protein, partial [Gammaproteobacteria bacterium]